MNVDVEITKDLNKKPIERDTGLSVANETISNPGEPTYSIPKKDGDDPIFNGSISRGYAGSTQHPRG